MGASYTGFGAFEHVPRQSEDCDLNCPKRHYYRKEESLFDERVWVTCATPATDHQRRCPWIQ